MEANNCLHNLSQRNQSAASNRGTSRPTHETNRNILAPPTGKDVNTHTYRDGPITAVMAATQRIAIVVRREGCGGGGREGKRRGQGVGVKRNGRSTRDRGSWAARHTAGSADPCGDGARESASRARRRGAAVRRACRRSRAPA